MAIRGGCLNLAPAAYTKNSRSPHTGVSSPKGHWRARNETTPRLGDRPGTHRDPLLGAGEQMTHLTWGEVLAILDGVMLVGVIVLITRRNR